MYAENAAIFSGICLLSMNKVILENKTNNSLGFKIHLRQNTPFYYLKVPNTQN